MGRRHCLLGLVCSITLLSQSLSVAQGPQSAKVKAIVEKAAAFLDGDLTGYNQMQTVGGPIIVGLAVYKYHDVYGVAGGKNHPKVAKAKTSAVDVSQTIANPSFNGEKKFYEVGLAAILLLEVDPDAYRPQIAALIKSIETGQKKNGSWGYPAHDYGDTSVSQFCILALWTAKNRGFEVKTEVIANGCNWLLRTQDPSGAWGYQEAVDPGVGNFVRTSQAINKENGGNHVGAHSDAACGLGSLYISAGLLQFVNQKPEAPKKNSNVNSALQVKKTDAQNLKPLTDTVPDGFLRGALTLGDGWFNTNFNSFFSQEFPRWPFYFLYTYERYRTFKGLAERAPINDTPSWYVAGTNYLVAKQQDDGSFTSAIQSGGPAMDTCFAMFFLMRSTLKSVLNLARDTTFVSLGELPEDAANARIVDGKIVTTQLGGDITTILSMLEDPNAPQFKDMKAIPAVLKLSADEKERQAQIDRLKTLISQGNPQARRIAIRQFSRERGLDAVPTLLYALSDPDETATREARNALRFISRRLDGFGMPDVPSATEKAEAIEKWRNWYLQVRPEAELEPEDIAPSASAP
ncbi:MAG: terpene cyclase/mutase family protein [Planctomycetaceae bacterium]|jgi:hypothetical protein|nr:terpene cyclase/mutase family protein [Planctomycetaceae bacterium]